MIPNSITIHYKSKSFTLDRMASEGKYFRIGFESRNWGVRIYPHGDWDIQVVIEKSVKRSDDGSHTQFYWDCHCLLNDGGLFLDEVNDPATGKRISRQTKWFIIEPMLQWIHAQLREELDTMRSKR